MCAGRLASHPAASSQLLLLIKDTQPATAYSAPVALCSLYLMAHPLPHPAAPSNHSASKAHSQSTHRDARHDRARSLDLPRHTQHLPQLQSHPHHHPHHLRPRAAPTSVVAPPSTTRTATQTWAAAVAATASPHPSAAGMSPTTYH